MRLDYAVCHAILLEFGGIGWPFVHPNRQVARTRDAYAVATSQICQAVSGRSRSYSDSSNLGSRRTGGAGVRRGRSSRPKRSDGVRDRAPDGGPERGPAGALARDRSKLDAGRGPPPTVRASRITILSASFTASESRNTRATSGSSAMPPSRTGARMRSPYGVSRAGLGRGGRSARWYGSARVKSRGFALAAPNFRSCAARARGPLRVPAGASRSLLSKRFIPNPMPLSSGRAIHAAGSCRRWSSANPNGTRCTSASCSRLSVPCRTRRYLFRSAPRLS